MMKYVTCMILWKKLVKKSEDLQDQIIKTASKQQGIFKIWKILYLFFLPIYMILSIINEA